MVTIKQLIIKMNSIQKFKYILIFDLGNVIIDVNFDRFYDILSNKYGLVLSQNEFMQKLTPINMECNSGLITGIEFYNKCLNIFKIDKSKLSYTEFKIYWCDIFSLNNEMNNFLHQIKKDNKNSEYRIILASNTDPIHYSYIKGKYDFSFLDEEFLSYEEKELKPDASFFKKLITKYKIDLNRSIFVDDLSDNCNSARKEGLQTIQNINSKETIGKIMKILNT